MGITYRDRGVLIDIGKSKDNFDKDKKLRCFNYNIQIYQRTKREKETRKYYKCDCYDLRLGSDCNLGKDLSKSRK